MQKKIEMPFIPELVMELKGLQEVQQKITGDGAVPAEPTKPVAIGSPTDPRLPWRVWQKPRKADETQNGGNGDISGIFAGGKKGKPEEQPLPEISVAANSTVQQTVQKMSAPLTVADLAAAEQPFDPYAFFLTPSALPFDVYSTTLALGNNYGFGEYYGVGTGGSVVPSVPSPAPLTVFAVGGLMTSRKRA